MAHLSERPRGVDFYDPVLYLLGTASDFRSDVGIHQRAIRDKALALRGIDPRRPDWPLHGNSPPGLYREVHFAWRWLKDLWGLCSAPAPGLWGLTEAGVAAAREVQQKYPRWDGYFRDESPVEIGATRYLDPVVYLIGKMSGFKPYVSVRPDHIVADAPRLLGVQSDDIARRDVKAAWHVQTRGLHGDVVPLCSGSQRGGWELTANGVKKARSLCPTYEGRIVLSCGTNETARYLGEHFSRIYGRMTMHLRTKMPRSETLGKIEDHAMGWIEKIIQRDGLKERVRDGRGPAPSQICAWARRGAYSEIRNDGREPVCRVFHGALTPREIPSYDPTNWTHEVVPRTINESEQRLSYTHTEHSEDDSNTDPIEYLTDGLNPESTLSANLDLESVLDCISRVLCSEIRDEADVEWHRQVLVDRYVKEMTVDEIAEEHHIPIEETERITGALKRVKSLMRRARDDGSLDDLMS